MYVYSTVPTTDCILQVLVVIEKQLSEFRFSDGDGSKRNTTIFVQSKDNATVRIHIVPLQLGYIPLKVSAYSSLDSDAVLRTLLVEVRQRKSDG